MGTTGYTIVMVILAGWFAWLMTRMAAFTTDGKQTLVRLALALGAGILVPLFLLGVFKLVDRIGGRSR